MEKMTLHAHREADLTDAAKKILEAFPDTRIFALVGDLGAGKTALIKAFCKFLGVEQAVVSPSFSLVNEYRDRADEPVFHFDFYRIKKLVEVLDIGYEEYLFSGSYCFIEWADSIAELLPSEHVYIDIRRTGDGETRTIKVSGINAPPSGFSND